jgi:Flp pilus assembly protein TadB
VVVVVLTHLFVADLLTAEVREPIGVLVLVAAAASTFVGIIGDALE